jgi:hypothetical protein
VEPIAKVVPAPTEPITLTPVKPVAELNITVPDQSIKPIPSKTITESTVPPTVNGKLVNGTLVNGTLVNGTLVNGTLVKPAIPDLKIHKIIKF